VFTRANTLHDWAALRWFETLIPLYWLYERRPGMDAPLAGGSSNRGSISAAL
jgi:hypothetical protein